MSTNLCRVLLVGLPLLALTSCDNVDGPTCSPAPQITSTPPTVATVGSRYAYYAQATYVCSLFLPFTCGNVAGVQLPPGAEMSDNYITWTPGVGQANTDVRFVIATETDACGHRATQSWSVHVYPAPAGSGR